MIGLYVRASFLKPAVWATWYLEKLSTTRRGSLFRMKMGQRLSTNYKVWSPFRPKLAGAVLGGADNIWMAGVVYAVEFSHRSGRDLVNMAKKRTNVE